MRLGLWNNALKNKLIAANGSVQNIKEIPDNLKELYKTAWEIKGRVLVDMAADRGAFIDQSQVLCTLTHWHSTHAHETKQRNTTKQNRTKQRRTKRNERNKTKQSFNVFMKDVNFGKLTSMHFYAWKKGLKTGFSFFLFFSLFFFLLFFFVLTKNSCGETARDAKTKNKE